MNFTVCSNLVDIINREIYAAKISIESGRITKIERLNESFDHYVLPGFIDAHIHIESSMLVPSEFARLAVLHGTVGTISDPHEIANVLGLDGVRYMIENGKKVPFHFYFGAPSCVPATSFETAGAVIDSAGVKEMLQWPGIVYLAEMMNFPGVINKDEEVMKKLQIAKEAGKPVDGHLPGIKGEVMREYFSAGISTDHECYLHDEAEEKLKEGVKVMIREGSAAKNFNTLIPLLEYYPEQIMFCSDDKHPDGLIEGHIDEHVRRAIALGHDLFDVLRASSYNVIQHYNLKTGLLRVGDNADFIMVNNLKEFKILGTWINGAKVAEQGTGFIQSVKADAPNNFNCSLKTTDDFKVEAKGNKLRVIEALDGQLITNEVFEPAKIENGFVVSDTMRDVLKIAVVNRYKDAPVSVAFIKNIGLQEGAIASCIAHDSHNIVVVGVSDEDICNAVNLIIENKGGISVVNGKEKDGLPLPVAGIMTNGDAYETAHAYMAIEKKAKALGTTLRAPYMTLSFMALLVIPELKLSDKGLFNGNFFDFVSVFE